MFALYYIYIFCFGQKEAEKERKKSVEKII